MSTSYRLLVIAALLLGSLAMVVRNPKEPHRVILDVKEFARIIEREDDHVTAEGLADILMEGRERLLVVDVRDSASFAFYHIPTAVRYDMSKLVEASLPTDDSVVVYSDGGIHAAQAWMLLAAQGHRKVFTLRGGLNEWKDRILFPVVSAGLGKEEERRIEKRALFFGGGLNKSKPGSKPSAPRKPSTTPVPKIMKELERQREVC
ncbi:MAG: hypothetical protein HYY49_00955 [Ignavibacteriales bacterium]|nr:hypothetical protein [Ignavibacteriales bacterium]